MADYSHSCHGREHQMEHPSHDICRHDVPAEAIRLKPGRKKRFAPKTRTGCLTCRIRRIKCDEERPLCRRCIKGDYTCRYATDKTTHSATRQFQLQRDVRMYNASDYNNGALLQSLLPLYGSVEETCYLDKFLTFAAPWLSKYNDGSFFHVVLPQRSWHHPALRHTLVALAMAIEEARFPQNFTATRQHYWHHNQALRHIYAVKSAEEEEVVLLTSAMFWLHDNITNNSRTAVVHLQGFLRILMEQRVKRQQEGREGIESESQLLRGLVFVADVSSNAFAQVRKSDVVHSVRRRLRDRKYNERIRTMDGVCDELRLGLTAIPHSSRISSARENLPDDDNDNVSISTTELRSYFEKWYRAFCAVPTLTPTDRILLECHYICAALSLQIHQIGLMPNMSPLVDDPQTLNRMNHVLNRLEEIDIASLQQLPMTSDVELPVIPILAQIITLTNSGHIRRRGFAYLRRVRRVEGLWSTHMVADMMWTSHPPDGSRGPPGMFSNLSPELGVLGATPSGPSITDSQSLATSIPSNGTHKTRFSCYGESSDIHTMADMNAQGVTLPTNTRSLSASQMRLPNEKPDFSNITAKHGHTQPALDCQMDGEVVAGLMKGGMLLNQMMLSETRWTQNVSPEYRHFIAQDHSGINEDHYRHDTDVQQ